MNPLAPLEWAVIAASALGYYLLIRTILAVRQGVAWIVTAALRGVVAFVGARFILLAVLHRPDLSLLALAACGLVVATTRQRSRAIPPGVRRQVIAKYERSGKKYDSRTQELDHPWPFALGGSHTADNLRVLDRKANRRKGKKRPGLLDWF